MTPPLAPLNRGCVRQHGNIRRDVTHLDIIGVKFVERALGIHDLIDLLLLIDDKSAGVNFHKIVGEQPIQSPGVAVVRRIQPDVIHDRDRGGDVFTGGGRFLRRLA